MRGKMTSEALPVRGIFPAGVRFIRVDVQLVIGASDVTELSRKLDTSPEHGVRFA